ncbi:crossover junction endodeoxyribonuclease rusA, partial [Escherichia coli EC1870]|jgi:hypothetical protein
MYV